MAGDKSLEYIEIDTVVGKTIHPKDKTQKPIEMDQGWVMNNKPRSGGFLVKAGESGDVGFINRQAFNLIQGTA